MRWREASAWGPRAVAHGRVGFSALGVDVGKIDARFVCTTGRASEPRCGREYLRLPVNESRQNLGRRVAPMWQALHVTVT